MSNNINSKNFFVPNSDWEMSLSKLTGRRIIDVTGYATTIDDVPVFKLINIVFEDGTTIHTEGEHDMPYLPSDNNFTNLDEDTLQQLADEN